MATSEDYDSYMTHPLADFCECAIHLGLLQQPKLLPCGHSFCLDCLQQIHSTEVTKSLYPNSEVRCPTCIQQHQLPTGGIPKLPVDFKSNQMVEIINQETKQQFDVAAKELHTLALDVKDDLKLCTTCKEEGQSVTGVQYCITCSNVICDNCLVIHDQEMKQHVKVPLEYEKVICKTHKTRFVNRYCLQCSTPICMLCIMRGHSQHESAEFMRSDQTKHEQIQALRERLTQTENSLQTKLKSTTATKAKNSSDYLRTKQDIASCISKLKVQLDREQEQMIAQLDSYHSTSSKQIASSEVRIRELLKSVSDVTLQLHQVEYPLGIDNVTLTKHLPITLHLETSDDIEQGMSTVVGKHPCYHYSAGSANSGELKTNDIAEDAQSENQKSKYTEEVFSETATNTVIAATGARHNPNTTHNIGVVSNVINHGEQDNSRRYATRTKPVIAGGARSMLRSHHTRSEHIIVNPLYWKYIETHECGFLLKLKEQLALTHVELETDCDKLILAGKRRGLSVMKEYLQQNYEGVAFNLKHMPLPSITGRINVSDLCIEFPDVAFVQDDSGKMNVVGLKDNVDFCIMVLSQNTPAETLATNMDVENTRTSEAYNTKQNRRCSENMEALQSANSRRPTTYSKSLKSRWFKKSEG